MTGKNVTSVKEEDKIEKQEVLVYPNPAISQISFNRNFKTIEIISEQGKLAMSLKNIETNKDISLVGLPSGNYIVKALDEDNKYYYDKLIVVKE